MKDPNRKEEAEKLGYEVYELIAGGNAEAQNSQIERLLEKNISALLVCAVDRNKLSRHCCSKSKRSSCYCF